MNLRPLDAIRGIATTTDKTRKATEFLGVVSLVAAWRRKSATSGDKF